uniref:Photosystem I subunit VIII n=1 Tax=Epilobium palustre TaxID=669682 RepID=A0A8K1V9D7_9MYRT|nr:photosystem I subunit VIII [Epilobium palustre]
MFHRGTPFYDRLPLYFCAFSGPSISGNCNGFFISSC